MYSIQDKKEPRTLPTWPPFIGVALGMGKEKASYFVRLGNKFHLPIFTLRMLFSRIYVINATDLIQIVQAKANLSTFVPNLLDFGLSFSGVNEVSGNLLRDKFEHRGNSFTATVRQYLGQESWRQVASRRAMDYLVASVPDTFSLRLENEMPLLESVQHELLLAFTGAIYGPKNPYADSNIERSWHTFVPGIVHLLLSPLPWLTAWKPLRARARIQSAFAKYFESGGHHEAFPMVAEMYERNIEAGLTPSEAAKLELATSLAMLSSGSITAFWLLFHIYSDSTSLEQCRHELQQLLTPCAESDNEGSTRTVDVSRIKNNCPVLMAHLQETLRYHSTILTAKKVHHDTILADTYLLKKSAMVMVPGMALHHNPDIWGPTATSFDHRRFLDPDGQKKARSTLAFRPFGAGVTICPGRHFSTNVILGFVAMVLLQFDLQPADGVWRAPTKWKADIWNAMPKPDHDVNVKITPRRDVDGVEWKFVWGVEDRVSG